MYAAQLEAYRTAQNSSMSGREIEAAALTRCALMLQDCRKTWDFGGHKEKLADALRTNQMVWSVLQSELAREDNPLPLEVRRNLLTLSVFIDNRIIQIMAQPASEKLQVLIDINLNLAAGLRGSPAE